MAILALIHFLLFAVEQGFFCFVRRTKYSDSMVSMAAMILVGILLISIARRRKEKLSILPQTFGKAYVMATSVAVVILLITPSNFVGGIEAISLLIYASIVTPVFEEILFRGYVWNQLEKILKNELSVYITTTVLFGVWHLGYISSISFRVQTDLANVMVWKVITGLAFGVVLGALRLNTKNCYSTILLHGVMNVFGR